MSDPRFVPARCHARTTHSGDLLRRYEYVCMFRADHGGLHFSNEMWVEGQRTLMTAHEVVRWGTQQQLDAETGAACARCGNPGPFNSSRWCQDCASPVYT